MGTVTVLSFVILSFLFSFFFSSFLLFTSYGNTLNLRISPYHCLLNNWLVDRVCFTFHKIYIYLFLQLYYRGTTSICPCQSSLTTQDSFTISFLSDPLFRDPPRVPVKSVSLGYSHKIVKRLGLNFIHSRFRIFKRTSEYFKENFEKLMSLRKINEFRDLSKWIEVKSPFNQYICPQLWEKSPHKNFKLWTRHDLWRFQVFVSFTLQVSRHGLYRCKSEKTQMFTTKELFHVPT